MKEFIVSLSSIIILSLIIEIFCPAKVMKKTLFIAFSLVVVFVLITGIRNLLFSSENLGLDSISLSIETSKDSIFNNLVELTENQVKQELDENGIVVRSFELNYEIDEFQIKYTNAKLTIEDMEENQKNAKEIVSNMTGLSIEEIFVYE